MRNGSESSSVQDDTCLRESPIRPRLKPPIIPLIPSSTVLSAQMSKNRSMLSTVFSKKLLKLRGAKAYRWTAVLIIAYSFVIDDIRTAAFPPQSDIYVDITLILCILLFALDILMRIIKQSGYIWSLYFFLDLIATVAILADIQFFISALYSSCVSTLLRGHKAIGKTARLGASSLRLLGFVRKRHVAKQEALLTTKTGDVSQFLLTNGHTSQVLPESNAISLLASHSPGKTPSMKRESTDTPARHAKKINTLGRLYHMASPQQASQKRTTKAHGLKEESKIGKRLAERVVTLIALIVLAMTLLYTWLSDLDRYTFRESRFEYGLKLLVENQNSDRFLSLLAAFTEKNTNKSDLQYVIKLEIPGITEWGSTANIRSTDLCTVFIDNAHLNLNISSQNRITSIFSLCQTLLLCLLTLSIVVLLNADITNILVFPLERMMKTVDSLVQNPLNMFKIKPDVRKGLYEEGKGCCGVKKDFAHGEIRVLENAFSKIGVMLALVYGSAGSELITSCIKQEGDFTLQIKTQEVLAIFSFVHISHFDDLLASLNNKILVYINQIARLVHSQSEKYMGSVNKNLGDAFLLVWKFTEEEGVQVAGKFQVNAFSETVQQTASLALLSSIKTISKVSRSQSLVSFKSHSQEPPHLTFGFHVGWAYEGPIGSYYKVDASYLSPNVNIAARVESVAKQYGVLVLVSEDFYVRLHPLVQPFLRHIDTVGLKGVAEPVKLYSFDMHTIGLGLSQAKPTKRKIDRKRKQLMEGLESEQLYIYELFTQSQEIAHMRRFYSDEFFQAYGEALQLYLDGNWEQAAEILSSRCDIDYSSDGPTQNLLDYIESHRLRVPVGWTGVRMLMCK